jgi:F-type H+-transporting ATPase subunit a
MAKSFEKYFIQIILRAAFALVLLLSFQQLKANPGNDSHSGVASDSGMKHQHAATVGETSIAAVEAHGDAKSESHAFDAGHMIMEHISDAHDWHLWGHTHVALPVILYTDKGFDVFSSNNFRDHAGHGLKDYTGKFNTYRLVDEEVKVISNGEIDETASSELLDVSITKNTLTLFIVSLIMLLMFTSVARAYKKRPGQAPKGLQSFIEPLIVFVRDDIAKPNIGKKYEKFMPFLLTVFFFIWISNLLGLIPVLPGGANFTGNIAITLTLALLTFVITTINGNKHYWGHIFAMPGVPAWVLVILTPIEILGMFLRPFVLMIRLFANISAGHIIALAFFSLIFIFGKGGENPGAGFGVGIASWLFTVFMMFLELLVAFLQAFVFALLSAVYFGSAVEEGHHEEHAEHAH